MFAQIRRGMKTHRETRRNSIQSKNIRNCRKQDQSQSDDTQSKNELSIHIEEFHQKEELNALENIELLPNEKPLTAPGDKNVRKVEFNQMQTIDSICKTNKDESEVGILFDPKISIKSKFGQFESKFPRIEPTKIAQLNNSDESQSSILLNSSDSSK